MRRGTVILLLGLALGGAGLGAGCGGDDETDPKEEFIAQGEEICALGTFKIGDEAIKRYGETAPPPKEQVRFTEEVVVPVLRADVLDKLRSLEPPEGDAQRLNALYAALERGIDTLAASPNLYSEPNAGGAFDQANQLAQEYGFEQCGS